MALTRPADFTHHFEAAVKFDGWRVTLDEAGLDHLIKTLHKARSQAFGPKVARTEIEREHGDRPAGGGQAGCGEMVLESGTQDEASQALADHRALDPDAPSTPVEGGQ